MICLSSTASGHFLEAVLLFCFVALLVCCDLLVNVPLGRFHLGFVILLEGVSFLVQESLQLFGDPRFIIPERPDLLGVDGHIHTKVDVGGDHSSCTVNRAV